MKSNNCNALSPARQSLTRLPRPFGQGDELVGSVSVARVRPRTSTLKTLELLLRVGLYQKRLSRPLPFSLCTATKQLQVAWNAFLPE